MFYHTMVRFKIVITYVITYKFFIIHVQWHLLDLKGSNVTSTKEILKICRERRPKTLHYVSTIGIFAARPSEEITEDTLTDKNK